VPAAVILSQLLYWHGKQADPDGWIKKTASELEEETGVTERQQEVTRPALVESGLVEFQRRGIPAMPFYRVKHDKIIALYLSRAGETSFPEAGNQETTERGIYVSPVKGNLIPPNGDANTESTAENTQEITKQREPRRKTAGFASVLTEHGDARVAAYMDILAQKQITDTTAALIMERIGRDDIEVWRQILTAWAIGGDRGPYRADNLSGMFERFDATKNSKRFKTAVAQPIGEWRPAKGMYPQVPDKPQPPPAPRKATMFGIEVDTVDHSKTTEVPF
jgi:hypothetical protein